MDVRELVLYMPILKTNSNEACCNNTGLSIVGLGTYLKVTIFLQVLTFEISANWPKNAKFCTHKH